MSSQIRVAVSESATRSPRGRWSRTAWPLSRLPGPPFVARSAGVVASVQDVRHPLGSTEASEQRRFSHVLIKSHRSHQSHLLRQNAARSRSDRVEHHAGVGPQSDASASSGCVLEKRHHSGTGLAGRRPPS